MVSDEECQAAYGEDMWDNMICAGYPDGGKDSCNVRTFSFLSFSETRSLKSLRFIKFMKRENDT